MSKVKFLMIICIALLLANLAQLFFSNADPRDLKGEGGPKKIIIERLKLNADQQAKFEVLIKWHRTEVTKLEDEIMQMKTQLYSCLQSSGNAENKDSLIESLGNKQKEMEKIHYKHFEDIKALCNSDQLALFDELTAEIARLFAHGPPKKK